MTHRPLLAVAALLAPVVLGGCTLGGPDEAGPDPTGAAPAPVGDQPQEIGGTVEVLLAAAGEESVDLSGELPVLATRAATNAQGGYEVDLNGVAVSGELMTVVFTLRVLSQDGIVFSAGSLFDDGTQREGDTAGVSSYSTDGVYVLDPAAGTRHLVAYDSEGGCVCSTALNSVGGMDSGGSLTLSSTFAAPPEATTTVDVVIPSVGAFTGVTLER